MRESQRVSVAGSLDVIQTYDYDEVNRLETAEEQAGPTSHWKQVYAYDRFGNRTLGAGTTYPSQLDAANNPQVSPANNRITSAGYAYDEAGNLLCDPVRSCAQSPLAAYYSYDAENKMKAAAGGFDSGGTTYSYDGDGRRVKKATYEGEVTVFVYDAAGRVVAEYSNQIQYNGTSYLTQDYLGSTRAVTGQDRSVRSRHDYFPFGEEIGAGLGERVSNQGHSQADNVRQKFTGYERDEETGLDFVQVRYYGSIMGRFTSVDPVLISDERLYDPQQINLYVYARNNPLKFVDPNGEEIWIAFEETSADGKKSSQRVQYKNGKLFGADGKEYKGNNSYALKVRDHLNKLKGDDLLSSRIGTLERSRQTHIIQSIENPRESKSDPESLKNAENNKPTGSKVYFNADKDLVQAGVTFKPAEILAHELLGHSWDFDQGKERRGSLDIPFVDEAGNKAMGFIPYREIDAVKVENRARALLGSSQRQHYGGWRIPSHLLQSGPSRRRLRR